MDRRSLAEPTEACCHCGLPFVGGEVVEGGKCLACVAGTHCCECGEPIDTLMWDGLCEPCLDKFEENDLDPARRNRRHCRR